MLKLKEKKIFTSRINAKKSCKSLNQFYFVARAVEDWLQKIHLIFESAPEENLWAITEGY